MKSSDNVEITSGARGQKIVRVFGRDDSSFRDGISDADAKNGGKMGGGATSLEHSLTGASANQHVKAK